MPGVNNECLPLFEDGDELTCLTTAAVTGKRFVAVTGNLQSDNAPTIGPPAAAGRVFGIAMYDAAAGARVGVWRGRTEVFPVTTGAASGAIAAFQELQVDATGAVVPLAAGVAVGYAVSGSAGNGADVWMTRY